MLLAAPGVIRPAHRLTNSAMKLGLATRCQGITVMQGSSTVMVEGLEEHGIENSDLAGQRLPPQHPG